VRSAPVLPTVDPLLGVELGGFRVTRLLAAGGMGLVYEAVHDAIGRRAAVKVLKPEVARDAEWTRRFLSEARTLGALKHRNLIEILNFGKTPDGREFLMMEFLEGESLEGLIHREAPLPPALALHLVDQVLNGLAEAHKKGIVHRDLKPSNVHLVREHNGERLVKVLDFGLAKQEPISLVSGKAGLQGLAGGASLVAGTPEYIAPEQAQGKAVDAAADLYSLGVMLFEMLTGQLPFSTEGGLTALLLRHINAPPPVVSSLVDGLPDGLEAFVDSLLRKDPAARPRSADEARGTVQRLLKQLAREATGVGQRALPLPAEPVVPARSAYEPTVRSLRTTTPRRRVGLVVGLSLVAVLVGAGLWRVGSVTPPSPARPVEPPAVVTAAPLEPVVPSPPVAPPVVPSPPVAPAPDIVVKAPEPPAPVPVDRPLTRKPRPVPIEPPSAAPPERCDPDFKQFLQSKLSALNNDPRVNTDDATNERWERSATRVLSAITKASTRAECAAAEDQLRRLRAEFKLSP
jgi:eukaryotic-like serine/threonine-protein kinase